tara:strand:- start:46 stop:972 length:927 start_codon:yes stop_codon:yes gene_type:complete
MSRCLVTGHKGYIGTKLHNKLKELGHDVLGIDLQDGHDINQELDHSFDGDSFHPLYYNFKPEYIFHMACIPRVLYSVENPVETMKNNVISTTNVLNFARKVSAKRVVFSSSSSVLGNGNGPVSPYALQKLISEMECKLYSEIYNVDTVSLRYFNVYSEDQRVDQTYATAIANWMHHIKTEATPFINGDGTHRRDMVHVDDVIAANIFVANHRTDFSGKVYDVGTGDNISLNQIVQIIHKWFPSIKFEYRDVRSGDVLSTKALVNPLKKLGWSSTITIDNGIESCFRRLHQHMNGAGRAEYRNNKGKYT